MPEFRPETLLESKRTLWIVSILTIALVLVTNLPWQLDDYDQAKQAFTSFEMIKEGHWFYQRTPHERIATKPPLVGWISAGLFATTRSWDIAWRLPSLLAATGIAILLFRATTSAYGSTAGLIALGAFGLNLLTPRLATLARTDMPLALVVFLIGLRIWEKIRNQQAWTQRDRLIIFALLSAGMLIKGPIVYAFLLPGIAIFQWWRRRTGATSAWFGWWPWLASLGVFLAWTIGGILLVPGFFDQVVVREFIGRFGTTIHRPKEFYFYFPHLIHKYAPWSVLMIAMAVMIARAEKIKTREISRKMSPETCWLICWSLGGLLAMSLIPSKRVDRIFPVIPPFCLFLAAQFKASLAHEQLRLRVLRWAAVALLFSILFTGGYTVAKVVSGYRDRRDALVIFGHAVRVEAAAHRWRYEALAARDEGLLLYLERLHFIEPARAVADWNRGTLDALVVPADEAPRFLRDLENASISAVRSAERKEERSGYVLITH